MVEEAEERDRALGRDSKRRKEGSKNEANNKTRGN